MGREVKKPSLALVISAGKKGDADEEAPPSSKELDDYGASLDELADVLGVADDKRQDFAEAFKAACMSCK